MAQQNSGSGNATGPSLPRPSAPPVSGCSASYYRIARLGVFYFDFDAICMEMWKLLAGVLLACEMPSACGRTRLYI